MTYQYIVILNRRTSKRVHDTMTTLGEIEFGCLELVVFPKTNQFTSIFFWFEENCLATTAETAVQASLGKL